jgi:hypothetical protein
MCRGKRKALEAGVRARVQHPFRVGQSQFGPVKVLYRGLTKATARFSTLFALSRLWQADCQRWCSPEMAGKSPWMMKNAHGVARTRSMCIEPGREFLGTTHTGCLLFRQSPAHASGTSMW